jgi:hypothetical protein
MVECDSDTKEHERLVASEGDLWRCYNSLLLSPNKARITRLIIRYRMFEMALNVPGDIVECGVFKGAGLMYWARLLEMFAPGTRKRVIVFDVFGPFRQVPQETGEEDVALRHDKIAERTSKAEIAAIVEAAKLAHRVELVEGDVGQTAAAYAAHYGLGISLLHLDLDMYAGTKAALVALWLVVSCGGIVVFDQYAVPGMGESHAVEEFFADKEIIPRSETRM